MRYSGDRIKCCHQANGRLLVKCLEPPEKKRDIVPRCLLASAQMKTADQPMPRNIPNQIKMFSKISMRVMWPNEKS